MASVYENNSDACNKATHAECSHKGTKSSVSFNKNIGWLPSSKSAFSYTRLAWYKKRQKIAILYVPCSILKYPMILPFMIINNAF